MTWYEHQKPEFQGSEGNQITYDQMKLSKCFSRNQIPEN
jgi:hypothetical protein